jgi:Flp pilus assembly protein TadD
MTRRNHMPLVMAFAATLGLAFAGPAFAFGGGSNSGGGSSGGGSSSGSGSAGNGSAATDIPHCNKGYVYDAKKRICVKATSSLFGDQELYVQGHDLALAGRYQEALDALNAVGNKDSMTLTMIGYATRKSGNYDQGVAYYQQALALDENNVNTHEYLGEAYAEKGKIDDAKAELVKVAALCGTTCEQYQDLAAAIAGTPNES